MPISCSAFGCSNHNKKENCQKAGISFHKFPLSNKNLLKQWLNNIKRKDFVPTETSKLCSEHFEESCFLYQSFSNRRLLKKDAVPSKFDFTSERSKRKRTTYSFSDVDPVENMEYINCCIPGCKSKSRRKRDFSSVTENTLLFPVPCGGELFNEWAEALKSTNIELTKDDYICECHFQENDIQRYHEAKTLDGDIIEIQKSLPTLKPHSVPVKNLKPATDKTKESSKKLSVLPNPDLINSEISICDKSDFSLSNCDSGNKAVNIKIENSGESSIESPTDSSVNFLQGQISHKKKCMPYSVLVKSIQLVKKPSMFWSVVCTDEYTIFARWNNKFITEKRLVIESSFTIRVFLKELELEITDLVDITCLDDVSSLLEKVENYKI